MYANDQLSQGEEGWEPTSPYHNTTASPYMYNLPSPTNSSQQWAQHTSTSMGYQHPGYLMSPPYSPTHGPHGYLPPPTNTYGRVSTDPGDYRQTQPYVYPVTSPEMPPTPWSTMIPEHHSGFADPYYNPSERSQSESTEEVRSPASSNAYV